MHAGTLAVHGQMFSTMTHPGRPGWVATPLGAVYSRQRTGSSVVTRLTAAQRAFCDSRLPQASFIREGDIATTSTAMIAIPCPLRARSGGGQPQPLADSRTAQQQVARSAAQYADSVGALRTSDQRERRIEIPGHRASRVPHRARNSGNPRSLSRHVGRVLPGDSLAG
jgi:hypothetical protein